MTTPDHRPLVVTGASGYIGRHLLDLALEQRRSVVALSRSPLGRTHPALRELPYELESAAPLALPDGVGAVVHLAARTGSAERDDDVEATATERLHASAREAGARFVFVSSQAAGPDAPTVYGRSKFLIEESVLARGGTVVRLGMVSGGQQAGGLFLQLADLVRRLPVVPRLVPGPSVQPISVGDACRALLAATTEAHVGERLLVAQPETLRFDRFLVTLARVRFGRARWRLPLPVALPALALWITERSGMFPGLTQARLTSLTSLRPMDTRASLERLGLELAGPGATYGRPSERRRQLLREGAAMLRYTGPAGGSTRDARQYARAVERLQDGYAFDPACRALRWPWWLGVVEQRARRSGDTALVRRFDMALALGEALRSGAYPTAHRAAWLRAVLTFGWAGLCEAVWRVGAMGGGGGSGNGSGSGSGSGHGSGSGSPAGNPR